ncbi:MAG TPA: helix-turn-helix domain-containing protein [Candidatus Binataceae bacterium]|nr:helix-turn-helix domain-containing protein [Candidatus Binataceae bacterium]
MTERIAITLDGRTVEIETISDLPRESVAGLSLHLAALQAAIATRFCAGNAAQEVSAGGEARMADNAGNRLQERPNGASHGQSPSLRVCGGHDRHHLPENSFGAEEVGKLLSVKQVAERFGLSQSTLYHWIESGKLNGARGLLRFGGRRLIDAEVLSACMRAGEFT